MTSRARRTSISLWLGWAVAASSAAAQTILPTTVDDMAFRIQVANPFLAEGEDVFEPFSPVIDSDFIFRWSDDVFLQVGFPLAVASRDGVGTSVYLGNLRGNFLFGEPGVLRSFIGFTVPTASNIGGPNLALLVMALPSFDEEEAWAEDVLSVRGAWVPSWPVSERGRAGLRLGGALAMPTEFDDMWIYVRPTGWVRFYAGTAELKADLITSYLSNGEGDLGTLSTAYLDLAAGLPGSWGHPEVFLRLPLDTDARDALDFSVGIAAQL